MDYEYDCEFNEWEVISYDYAFTSRELAQAYINEHHRNDCFIYELELISK